MFHSSRTASQALVLFSAAFLTGAASFSQGVHHLPQHRTPRGQTVYALGTRFLYVWDDTIPGDASKTSTLLAFAAHTGVDVIAIDATGVGYGRSGAIAAYTSFASSVHAAGMQVLALGGYSWFAVAPGAVSNQPTSQLEGWGYYQAIAQSGVAFDGILDDTEPAGADATWWSNHAVSGQQYLDYLHGVDQRIGVLAFYHAMPFWYDEDASLSLMLDGETQAHPLNWYVQRIVDVVALMDYRDVAAGPNGIIAHAQGEMALGPCVVGVETGDLGPADDAVTFWEEGNAYMEQQLGQVYGVYGSHSNFRGFAIHDYASYSQLAP